MYKSKGWGEGAVKKGLSFQFSVSSVRIQGWMGKWGADYRGPVCPAVQLGPQELRSRRVTG